MKKHLVIAATTLSLITSVQAIAKDNNFEVGLNIAKNSMDSTLTDIYTTGSSKFKLDDSSVGFGVSGGYNYSIGSFLINPTIYADYLNSEVKVTDSGTLYTYNYKSTLNARVGANLNLGYQIKDVVLFATAGLAINQSELEYKYSDSSGSGLKKETSYDPSFVYGIGAKYYITQNVGAELSYNRSNVDQSISVPGGKNKYDTDLDQIKLGLLYRF